MIDALQVTALTEKSKVLKLTIQAFDQPISERRSWYVPRSGNEHRRSESDRRVSRVCAFALFAMTNPLTSVVCRQIFEIKCDLFRFDVGTRAAIMRHTTDLCYTALLSELLAYDGEEHVAV